MRPFSCLPDNPRWSYAPASDYKTLDGADNAVLVTDSFVVQRVGASHTVALTPHAPGARLRAGDSHDAPIAVDTPKPTRLHERTVDIASIWPAPGADTNGPRLDMVLSLDPGFLNEQYTETLYGSGPLALFPKHVLAKARIGFGTAAYTAKLHALALTQAAIDSKYDGSDEQQNERAQDLVAHMAPLQTVLQRLRVRETQLQVLVGLELLSLIRAGESTEEKAALAATEQALDQHFDRLCIWQATAPPSTLETTDPVGDFCSAVIVPFFRAREPHKAKQLVRISRGTLRSRRRKAPRKLDRLSLSSASTLPSEPSKPTPVPGLLRALSMQGHITQPAAPAETSAGTGAGSTGGVSDASGSNGSSKPSQGAHATRAERLPSLRAPTRPLSRDLLDGVENAKRGTGSTTSSAGGGAGGGGGSHPVYRQQSRHNSTVEVRFRKSRHGAHSTRSTPEPSGNVIPDAPAVPLPPAKPATAFSLLAPRQPAPAAAEPPPREPVAFVEGTPTKVRTAYLTSLPEPTTLDFDEIGSTDNDE